MKEAGSSLSPPVEDMELPSWLLDALECHATNGEIKHVLGVLNGIASHVRLTVFDEEGRYNQTSIRYLADLILPSVPETKDTSPLYRASQHGHCDLVDFSLCLCLISRISIIKDPSVLKLSLPFIKWFRLLENDRYPFKVSFSGYNDFIVSNCNHHVHSLFRKDCQTVTGVIKRFRTMMLLNRTKKNTKVISAKLDCLLDDISKAKSNIQNNGKREENNIIKFSHTECSISNNDKRNSQPYRARFLEGGNIRRVLNSELDFNQDEVSNTKPKKKKKPVLNFYEKDDVNEFRETNYFTYSDDDESEHLSVQRGSATVLSDDEKEQHNNIAPKDDHFESLLDGAIGNKFYHSCNLSIGIDDYDTRDWDITSENKSEWEIIIDEDERSIDSFDSFDMIHPFHALSYKDALLKLDGPLSSRSPSIQKPKPVLVQQCAHPVHDSTRKEPRRNTKVHNRGVIKPIIEDKEDETFDFYFDYDGYKGARGSKAFTKPKKAPKNGRRPRKSDHRKARQQ